MIIRCGADALTSGNYTIKEYFNSYLSKFGVGIKYALSRLAKPKSHITMTTKTEGSYNAFTLNWKKSDTQELSRTGETGWEYDSKMTTIPDRTHFTKVFVHQLDPSLFVRATDGDRSTGMR